MEGDVMVAIATVVFVLMIPIVAIAAPLMLAEAWRRRRARIIARQIELTDAIHAELGALVAPIVEKHVFRPWRVVFPLPSHCTPEVGRLIAIADRVVGTQLREADDLHIVFTHAA